MYVHVTLIEYVNTNYVCILFSTRTRFERVDSENEKWKVKRDLDLENDVGFLTLYICKKKS